MLARYIVRHAHDVRSGTSGKAKNEEGPGDDATLPADGTSSLGGRTARQVEVRHITHHLQPTCVFVLTFQVKPHPVKASARV